MQPRAAPSPLGLPLLCTLLPLLASAGGDQALFLDLPGEGGGLLTLEEGLGTAERALPKLAGLVFLPIDFCGRSARDELIAGRPRFQADLPGASRIALPIGGYLHRYQRSIGGGARAFGFLWVDPAGRISTVGEVPGAGPLADLDPYLARVALADGGRRILCATRLEAGGDLVELDLVQRTRALRTPNLPPLAWREGGLALANGFGVGVASRGVFRFELAPGSVAERVVLDSPAPVWHSGALALSPSGDFAICTAGAGASLAHAYVFGRVGPARRVTSAPAPLSGAGHLPDAVGGPFLAVTDDGSLAAWRVEGATRELFLGKANPGPGELPVQVTADAYYIDTLDEVGLLIATALGSFLIAVGEAAAPGQPIESADIFRVSLDASGQPHFENVTLSSGQSAPPYTITPQLSPAFVRDLPEAGGALVWDEQSGGTGRILAVRPAQPGVQVLLDDVRSLDWVSAVGDELALCVERDTGSRPRQILRLRRDLGAPPVLVHEVLQDVEYLNPIASADGWVAFLVRDPLGVELVRRVWIASGAEQSFALGGGDYGEVLGLSPAGALLLSRRGAGNAQRFFSWASGGASFVEIPTADLDGFWVPGR